MRGTLPDANHVCTSFTGLLISFVPLVFFLVWSTRSTFENLNHGLPHARIPEALSAHEGVGEPKNWFLTLLHASQIERGEPESGHYYERSVVANDNEQSLTTYDTISRKILFREDLGDDYLDVL